MVIKEEFAAEFEVQLVVEPIDPLKDSLRLFV